MKDTDLAWLAGIFDGEGSITMFSHIEKSGTKKICPTVAMYNTDIGIISKVQKILEELKCSFVIHEFKPANKKHKLQWRVTTRNIRYIAIALQAMLPYLTGDKLARAEIVLRYANRRIERQIAEGRHNPEYDEQDWRALKEVRDNIRSSETTRETQPHSNVVKI